MFSKILQLQLYNFMKLLMNYFINFTNFREVGAYVEYLGALEGDEAEYEREFVGQEDSLEEGRARDGGRSSAEAQRSS